MSRAAGASHRDGRRSTALRSLPQIHELLESPGLRDLATRRGRALVAALVRERLGVIRKDIRQGTIGGDAVRECVAGLGEWVEAEAGRRTASTLRPVVNATGVVLHTNLGRAPLPAPAARRLVEVACAYATLEYDLDRGRRGSRATHLDRLFSLLFPGRAVHVVNNNAAAVLLALNTLGEGREVIVSRGELVEIGGSFRIPDIMRKSGAILREVGTTNKTRLQDYARAIGRSTGLLLKVHPSNYRIVGFTAQVPLADVVALGRRHRIPVLMDQGSGNLIDLEDYGIRNEPSVHDALAGGADVVCFSGDKLLGGPQAGLLVGRPTLIRKIRDNPLSRALRIDKLTFAALEDALLAYAHGSAVRDLPVLRMLALPCAEIERRARALVDRVAPRLDGRLVLEVQPGASLLGGGSAPGEGLPTALVSIRSPRMSARSMEVRLRRLPEPVVGRIEGNRVLLDLRTVFPEQDAILERALLSLTGAEADAPGVRR